MYDLNVCNMCIKRVLSHARRMQCSFCKCKVHLSCLPAVDKNNALYTNRESENWMCIKCCAEIFPFNHYIDDSHFLDVLSKTFSSCKSHVSLADLENKIFIPFEVNDDPSIHESSHDPDYHYYNMSNQLRSACDYHTEDSFNIYCTNKNVGNNNFSILHANIRSVPKNLGDLELYLSNLNNDFSVLALSETWLKDSTLDHYGLHGYNSEHNVREGKIGGGVSLFLKDGIEYIKRDDISIMDASIECIFVEIDKLYFHSQRNIVVGVIYRPPGADLDVFNQSLSDILSCIGTGNKSCYIAGDFNINILNSKEHSKTSDFIDLMFSYSLMPHINKPTRVTERSATLIDNIFSNEIVNDVESMSGILYTDISDHYPIFHIIKSSSPIDAPKFIFKRTFSASNVDSFKEELLSAQWAEVTEESDAQRAYSKWHNIFSDLYNKHFPIKKVKLGYKNRKPWLSNCMKISIMNKNKLFRKWKRSKTSRDFLNYKAFRNKLTAVLRTAERNYFENILQENKNNLKNSWRIIKDVINKNKKSNITSKFLINNQTTTNKSDIANGFNSFFVNIGPTLAKSIPRNDKCPTYSMNKKALHSMLIVPTFEDEVSSIIKSLNSGAAGWDSVSMKLLKSVQPAIIHPLTYVLNLSLTTGIFPRELKIARVIPLFKSGDITVLSNYRPVSVLPAVSKILEKLMFVRLLSFLKMYKILYDNQFGFRDGHSPNLALILLIDKISCALERGDFVLGLFLDFSKAFDTVNHSILLQKLEFYGVRGLALNWFQSYLYDRSQYVEYNNVKSSNLPVSCGVPQGSILGPLLFILYINDLPNISSKFFSIFFADDSSLFLSGEDYNDLLSQMNVEITSVVEWLNVNKLSLNLKKTHFILFKPKKKTVTLQNELVISGVKIARTNCTKFLGVYVDESLIWNHHLSYIKGKIARGLVIINKTKKSI